MYKYSLFFVLTLAYLPVKAAPATGLGLKKLASGFSVPWSIEQLTEQSFLLTEREGKLIYLDLGKKQRKPILGLPKLYVKGQGGLLDVIKHPRYEKNKTLFLTYSREYKDGSTTALAEAVLDLKGGTLKNLKEIFVANTDSSKTIHYGSRLVIAGKYIYMSIGDRGRRGDAQKLNLHNGKVVRLHLDGTIPKDNPFAGRKDALPEIYSYGHRNPQGIAHNPASGQVFVSEHGPRGGDEINLIKPGANYGWPVITYGKEYWGPSIGEGTQKKGVEQPLKFYIPSIAPSSLQYYSHDKLSEFKDSFLLGALAKTHLNVVSADGKKETRYFEKLEERVRSVKVLSNGRILFATDSGHLYEIIRKK